MTTMANLATRIEEALLLRNVLLENFFVQEARKLAEACHEMSERFLIGGPPCLLSAAAPVQLMRSMYPSNSSIR